jgi:hypothetical protein
MADDIVIDKQLFHERLSSLVTKWKADKRSGDAIFHGASSIAAMVGKPSDPGTYLKPAAFQVSLAGRTMGEYVLIQVATAMVARLRIPTYALRPHARSAPDRHNQEEGCVSKSALKEVRLC